MFHCNGTEIVYLHFSLFSLLSVVNTSTEAFEKISPGCSTLPVLMRKLQTFEKTKWYLERQRAKPLPHNANFARLYFSHFSAVHHETLPFCKFHYVNSFLEFPLVVLFISNQKWLNEWLFVLESVRHRIAHAY